ncbi:DNA-binding response regulator, OmpR family, contains REC and winged-helix (wHTH) domain [Reichenbachiella faecimaris]|uniref:DNA-binding response regulator, OmpR family, contains REC and winged-helix (WHTH) domain n=1 Tax=Reichenbachiella faecimaris TaxID=692418 RepID=A0A1W2GCQ6_REIFA|nr:response regulator transcription factor [Reichenbachiella faecimaris]SMD34128.1 DNA-binding response regulator, OmpR family, contains REC and winged-helix (wHTH) domain [Reichenbachiella faecimaris]
MSKIKILLVEDDPNLGQILNEYLQLKGYETVLCQDGEAGFKAYQSESFDFCILDVMMPKKDGFSLARDIRAMDKQTPMIFLTAKSMKEDTIEGLKLGADDYLTKPFSMEELLLRIQAILKRTNGGNSKSAITSYQLGHLLFRYDKSVLERPSGEVKLTSRENELLKLFCDHMNETLDRSVALMAIWKDDSYFNARSMDVYIAKLRKYLKEEESVHILTVHGQGFKLVKME